MRESESLTMDRFQSVGLKQRFIGIAVAFILIIGGLSGYALRVNRSQNRSVDWAGRVFMAHESLHGAQEAISNARRGARGYLLYGDETGLEQYTAAMNDFDADFGQARAILKSDDPAAMGVFDGLYASVTGWRQGDAEAGIALRRDWTGSSADLQSAALAFAQSDPPKVLFTAVTTDLDSALTEVQTKLMARITHIQRENRRLTAIVIWTLGLLLAFSAALTIFLYRSIARPIARLSEAARGIASGDFSWRTGITRTDEIGRAAGAFDDMASHVAQLIAGLESAQAELFDRESRLTTILASVGDAILIVSPDGTIVQANRAAEALFDRAGVSLEGRAVERYIQRKPDMNVRGVYQELEHGPTKRDIRGFKATGEPFSMESTASRARINGAWHVVLCLRDMSQRVATEDALRRGLVAAEQARTMTRSVIDAANDVMLLISLDHRVALVNRRHEDFFGIAGEEILGRSIDEIRPVYERIFANASPFIEAVKRPFAADDPVRSVPLAQDWPAHRELALIVLPIRGEEDDELGTLCVLRDVSAEREADRLKSDFVSLVSHELRTPLTSIKGYVDLLLEGEVGPLSAHQSEFLDIVASSSTRLVSLTNDLLDVSRIEAGQLDLQIAPFDATVQVRNVAAALRPQIDGKRQTLIVEIPSVVPDIRGESNRFVQILTNLVSNANKYTPEGGAITIRVDPEGNFVRFTVSDDGAGLTTEEQHRLFSRFYRVRNRATQKVSGTGLGLSISKSLVEAHGGTIGVKSTPGEGATFFFTIPTAASMSHQSAVESSRPIQIIEQNGSIDPNVPARTGTRVLIVEDEPDIATLLKRFLERAGHETRIASTGAEAIDLADAYAPSLITLDIALPDTDGFTVLERLRSNVRTASIPVLVVSVLASTKRERTIGAVDYLTKPVDERQLVESIRVILNGSPDSLILVADDDAPTRRLLRERLVRAGFLVVEAAGGWEALSIAANQKIAMALIDVRMPDLNGIETLRRLRLDEKTRDLPVLMMTASAGIFDAQMQAIESLGATLLRGKNISAEELARVISDKILALGAATTSKTPVTAGSAPVENVVS